MATGLLIGGLADAVIERVVAMASTHIKDYFKRRKGAGDELQRLKMLLPQIQSVVDAAERGEQQISDPLQGWLRKLKDALYEADDVLDELDYVQLQQRVEADANSKEKHKVCELMSRSKSKAVKFAKHIFKPDPTLDKLRRVVKKLDEVAAGVGNFVALLSNVQREFQQRETQTTLRRDTGPLLTENKVYGREKERDELLQWLTMMPADHEDEGNMDVSLFSVVGHGGMGKTTLAQLVYNDEAVKKSFDLMIWVCVSTSFDVRELTRSILEHATKQRPNVDGLPALQDALKEKLTTSGKFLLVLDDVWNDDNSSNWDKLLAPLKYGRKGSKILLTTRMDRVADMSARALGASTKGSLKLGGLHGEDFSSLFNHYAFAGVNYENYQNLQCIGMQIAKRLGGSPLAAKTVGGLLNSNLDDRYWTNILHSKNISNRVQDGEDNIMSILMLSYHHLPLHLRPCFAYCGMFPKDYKFRKEDLVLIWMAVGLIQHSHQNQDEMLDDIGGYYFDNLLRRSLLDHKDDESYVMHDLLHDLAQSVCHGECSSLVDNDKKEEGIIPNNVRHLYIESDNVELLTRIGNWHNLVSLVLKIKNAQSEHFSALEKVFKSLKNIRMLNVDLGCSEVRMPDAFSHLIHLRNLKFDRGTLRQFPISLCKLYHLQVIQFDYNDGAIKLPKSMNKLVNLRHLSANNQVVGVGNLKFLRELSFSVKKERSYKIGELGDLIWLRSLEIEGLENVKNQTEVSMAKLCNKKYLESLYLGWSVGGDTGMDQHELILDCLQPRSNLKGLTIHGYKGMRYANWMGPELINNLQRICLSDCSRLDHLPPIGWLSFLKKFELKNMPAIKKLDYQCQHLHELHISEMEGLEELSRPGTDACQCHPHLETLGIVSCPRLWSLEGLMGLRSIGHLSILDCPRLMHATGTGTVGSDLTLAVDTLHIDNPLLLVSGVLRGLTSVRDLRIGDFQAIEDLNTLEPWLLQNKTTLESIEMIGAFSLGSLSDIFKSLSSLKSLYICGASETLMEGCRKDEGWDWPNISHIQGIEIWGTSGLGLIYTNDGDGDDDEGLIYADDDDDDDEGLIHANDDDDDDDDEGLIHADDDDDDEELIHANDDDDDSFQLSYRD